MNEDTTPAWNLILSAVIRLLWAIRDKSKGGLMFAVAELEDLSDSHPKTFRAFCAMLNTIENIFRDEDHQ